jgi:hypothetical protein
MPDTNNSEGLNAADAPAPLIVPDSGSDLTPDARTWPGAPSPWNGPVLSPNVGAPDDAPAASRRRPAASGGRHRKRRWIVPAIIAAMVLVAGGGLAFGLAQYQAPAHAVTQFCSELTGQQYTAAYGLLATGERNHMSAPEFGQLAEQLDALEGTVVSCKQASGHGTYQYRLGAGAAAVVTTITRQRQETLRGVVHLVYENGTWKIGGLDTSLLGINLGALSTADAYCQALQAQDYAAAYALLAGEARDGANAAQFKSLAQTQDQVDGKVTGCALVELGSTNNDATAELRIAVTRVRLGKRQGLLGLSSTSGTWKIDSVDASLQGTNLAALYVAIRWCGDINSGNYADAYTLSVAKTQVSLAQFINTFDGPQTIQGQTFNFKWATCRADVASYGSMGTTATVTAAATWVIISNGQTISQNYTIPLDFIKAGSGWLWLGIGTPTPTG